MKENIKTINEEINKVKNFLQFKKIFEKTKGKIKKNIIMM